MSYLALRHNEQFNLKLAAYICQAPSQEYRKKIMIIKAIMKPFLVDEKVGLNIKKWILDNISHLKGLGQ